MITVSVVLRNRQAYAAVYNVSTGFRTFVLITGDEAFATKLGLAVIRGLQSNTEGKANDAED